MLWLTRLLCLGAVYYGYIFVVNESRLNAIKQSMADQQDAALKAQTAALNAQAVQQQMAAETVVRQQELQQQMQSRLANGNVNQLPGMKNNQNSQQLDLAEPTSMSLISGSPTLGDRMDSMSLNGMSNSVSDMNNMNLQQNLAGRNSGPRNMGMGQGQQSLGQSQQGFPGPMGMGNVRGGLNGQRPGMGGFNQYGGGRGNFY